MKSNLKLIPTDRAQSGTSLLDWLRIRLTWQQLYLGGFALLWIVELYLVQMNTLVYANDTGPRFAFWAPIIRFVFDALFVGALVVLLPRRALMAVSVVVFLAHLGLVSYVAYFHRPLSFLTFIRNWQGASQLAPFTLRLLPKLPTLLLLAALIVKLALLSSAGRLQLPRRVRWRIGTLAIAAHLALSLVINRFDPLADIQTTRGVGRVGAVRGYLEPWLAEWYYLGDPQLLERALEERRKTSDALTPIEASIPIRRRLIVIQVESLDNSNLGRTVDGQDVTPFLNRLKDVAMYYRVGAFHSNGSSDADFVVLNGVRPSPKVNTYSISGYPYNDSLPCLPKFVAERGYRTQGLHGYSGSFYERQVAWEKMGFDDICFEAELQSRYGLRADRWGVRDHDVFDVSRQLLKEAGTDKVFHFIITLTTHTPYTMLEPQPDDMFVEPATPFEYYTNNMHYIDRCLRDYLGSLRDATVMIYADHCTEVSEGSFAPDRQGILEYIPCLIYDTEEDLSQRQQTRGGIAVDGSLNLLDMITYLRRQIEVSGDRSQSAKPTP